MIVITQQDITPMLRLVLKWTAVVGAVSYAIKLREAAGVTVVTVTTDETRCRLGAMKNATWYHFQILAIGAGAVVLDDSNVQSVWSASQGGTAPLLRQAAFDALEAADMTMVDDGMWMPRAWGATAAPSATLPAIEILMPELLSSGPYSDQSKIHNWKIPINIIVSNNQGDPDRNAASWLLFELVQVEIDTNGLNLNACGVMDENWTWSASLVTRAGRGKTTKIEAGLTVPVIKRTEVILIPQPAVIPEQPEVPEEL
jgi:hypothetical protein